MLCQSYDGKHLKALSNIAHCNFDTHNILLSLLTVVITALHNISDSQMVHFRDGGNYKLYLGATQW